MKPSQSAEGDRSFPQESFEALAELESNHFWFEARNRLILYGVQTYFPDVQNFLEIGCGTGFVLQALQHRFPSLIAHGSDLYEEGLAYAVQRLPDAHLFQLDARTIPFEQEFDVIGAFDVIEHIDEDETVLAQMYKAVKPGGGIILSVPQHPFMWSVLDELSFHKRRYTRADLKAKVERAGFHIRWMTSFVSLLLPLMWLTRSTKSSGSDTVNLMAEFQIDPLVNRALTSVMAAEYWLIRAGVSLPFGGSLLLVAQRPVEQHTFLTTHQNE